MSNYFSYFLLFNLNYIFTIYLFLNIINNIYQIKTISEVLIYFFKNNFFLFFFIVLFNLIGIPPMPSFYIKINLFFILLKKYNIFFYSIIIIFNIFFFFFYLNIFNFYNITHKSKKYFFLNNYQNKQLISIFIIYILFIYNIYNYFFWLINNEITFF